MTFAKKASQPLFTPITRIAASTAAFRTAAICGADAGREVRRQAARDGPCQLPRSLLPPLPRPVVGGRGLPRRVYAVHAPAPSPPTAAKPALALYNAAVAVRARTSRRSRRRSAVACGASGSPTRRASAWRYSSTTCANLDFADTRDRAAQEGGAAVVLAPYHHASIVPRGWPGAADGGSACYAGAFATRWSMW